MTFNRLLLAVLCALATNAWAARNPDPPPSGIVVHLFGPNSVTSNIAPDLPGETANPAGAAPEDGPSLGAVLHQMFVVGDPQPFRPPPGRAADRPPAGD